MYATKVQILDTCSHCRGQAYLPVEEIADWKGEKYMRHAPCAVCGGSGKETRWVELPEFLLMLEQSKCPHKHSASQGGFHLSEGVIWDDIQDVCSDCGQVL